MTTYGRPPLNLGHFNLIDLPEMMYYLYLPVMMRGEGGSRKDDDIRLPRNVSVCMPLIRHSILYANRTMRYYRYAYLSARKGWATRDNPLNRPGWHCDGFGTDDLNFVWWRGPGTRFLVGDPPFEISNDHIASLDQFEKFAEVAPTQIQSPPQAHLYGIMPDCIHATPIIEQGCMRQYVKVSLSNHHYNLKDNSHNHLFEYDWVMHDRAEFRNDTDKAQRDYV